MNRFAVTDTEQATVNEHLSVLAFRFYSMLVHAAGVLARADGHA